MKKFTLSSLLFLFAFALVTTTFTSCGDEEPEDVMGCTDADADNYNENANVSDASCTYQNCFTGSYAGVFGCQILPFESADLLVEASPTNDQQLNLTVTSETLATPIPLIADIVNCSQITLLADLDGIDLSGIDQILMQFGPDARWDIDVTGELTRQGDDTLAGSISFTLTEVGLGSGVVLPDTCTFVATPN